MMSSTRLLAFAFAAADLLLEVDDRRVVTFVAGASPCSAQGPAEQLAGTGLSDLFTDESDLAVALLLGRLHPGVRSPTIDVRLLAGEGLVRPARFSAFMEPHLAPHVCCAISFLAAAEPGAAVTPPAMLEQAEFDAAARQAVAAAGRTGEALTVSVVAAPGLPGAIAKLGNAPAASLLRRLERALLGASCDGALATRLAADRFAVLGPAGAEAEVLQTVIGYAASGIDLGAQVDQASLPAGPDAMLGVRALRYVLDGMLAGGKAVQASKLKFALERAMSRTLREADDFRTTARTGKFELVYQPIMDLSTRTPLHWEVLARLERNADPSAVLRMAEELSLIVDFDLAVVRAALARNPGGPGAPRLAVNIAGASLASDRFIAALIQQTAPEDRARLILEIHESTALHDLQATEKKLQTLKRAGFGLSWDDFGAGGAALDQLAALSVDTVKLEGGFTRRLESDPKAVTVATHIARLCRSLGRVSIAKMIETDRSARVLASCGVDAGQGFLFGRPSATLPSAEPTAAPARRQGFSESWG